MSAAISAARLSSLAARRSARRLRVTARPAATAGDSSGRRRAANLAATGWSLAAAALPLRRRNSGVKATSSDNASTPPGYWPKGEEPRGLAGVELAAAIDAAEANEDQ